MNQENDAIPRGGEVRDAVPPADKPAETPLEQAPLGAHPTYDAVLDTAVDYSFPCSDPIAVDCCQRIDAARR